MISKPNTDQAGRDELQGGVTSAIRRYFLDEFEGMLPATVVSYDDATNRAVIKPLVMIGTTDNRKVSRARVPNIPVFRFGGGGFFMRFPIKPGDFGWLKANDRDISLIFQRGGLEDWPNTTRMHKFSDAMFFPDTFKQWVINGANADAAVWQNMNGSVCISLHEGKIKLEAPEMEVNVSETTWNGNITQQGNYTSTGERTSSGSISHSGTFELDGTVINTHDHGGVSGGLSRTDPFGQ